MCELQRQWARDALPLAPHATQRTRENRTVRAATAVDARRSGDGAWKELKRLFM